MRTACRKVAGILLGIFLLTLVSGSPAREGAGAAGVPGQKKSRAPRGGAHYEEWLKREVRHRLLLLPWYSVFDNLEYKVEGYRVTLMGSVVRPTLKDDAEATAKKIEGVESVVNKIEVLPVSPNDHRLRLAVFRAIYSQPALQRYAIQAVPPIHIIVKNGHVTLEGVVASEADKNLAFIQANGVPDVFSVTNHLIVEKSSIPNPLCGAKPLPESSRASAAFANAFLIQDTIPDDS